MNNPLSISQIKAITFFSNYGKDPCAHLRVRGPLGRLGIDVIEGVEDGKSYPERVSQGDLILLQRDFPRDLKVYEEIIELARQQNKPVVLDLDDLLFSLPENHPDRLSHQYTESLLPMLQALHEVDCVTVTTTKLKNDLRRFAKNIIVLPNYFDDAIWNLKEPILKSEKDLPVIIGYMGSESHIPDIASISPVISTLLKRYPTEIQFHFWGVKPPKELAGDSRVKWIPAQTYEYTDFARYFGSQYADIFIGPLVDNWFNRSKSPLKFFEYTALGVPGVYSRLEPFEQVITAGHDGLLAYSQEEWIENLEQLIHNKDLRYQIALNAQDTIRSKWLLSKNYYRWAEAYNKIMEGSDNSSDENETMLDLVHSITHQYIDLLPAKNKALQEKDEQIKSLSLELAEKNKDLEEKEEQIKTLSFELAEIKVSKAWRLALLIRKVRVILIPPNTLRYKIASYVLHWLQGQKMRTARIRRKTALSLILGTTTRIRNNKIVGRHKEPIDIIICVHNAPDDIRRCLDSIKSYTTEPFSVIIIDDGSDEPTKEILKNFADQEPWCSLIRNEEAQGYTLAANIGMRNSKAPYLVLLNSDTIVGPEWLDRMYRAMISDEKIGVVGPLSNTASWQSIPKLSENGDWATNPLPPNTTVAEMSTLVSKYSDCIFPEVPLLNGFCMMIRKALIDEIGYFDENNFGQGFGEEDDFNLRAGDAGWKKVIADDVYIYHAQSKSYTSVRRYTLSRQSGEKLRKKHGPNRIADHVAEMNPNRVIEGFRSRANVMVEREAVIERGKELFAGKKILFILPVIDAGGGANVIIDETRCMRQMGVEAKIFNLAEYQSGFKQSYPDLDIPIIFGGIRDLAEIGIKHDAVIASANYSVEWLKPLQNMDGCPTLGYYVQGYEPLMYPEGSEQAKRALSTYTMIKNCRLFTKTNWTKNMVYEHTGIISSVVGISTNIDLFRPRDMVALGEKPVTIVAMVRPGSTYRNPELTLDILKGVAEKYGKGVNIWLFGSNNVKEIVDKHHLDFEWKQLGKLTQEQVASMMSKADIFTDFSSHQAMGLSALEAMASGCSVIVPKYGGAIEFVRHKENGVVVDTSSFHECRRALEELIEDDLLRKQLQLASIYDVVQYYPEKVSYNILNTLFRN